MAIQSKENPLNYTGLSYEDIKKQIDTSLKADSRFDNFVDSALYKSMMNLFAGSTDLTNYYVERTAEEMYLETAQHLSSVIANANNIGYIVRRPLGAQADITFKINGPIVSAAAGQEILIPLYSDLNYNGSSFKLLNGYKYELTADDANILQTADGSISFNVAEIINGETSESVPISILQGEERTFTISPGNITGQKWQKYNIDDPSFSNYFGESDFGDWNNSTETSSSNLTQVEVTDGVTSRLYYINKRSLTSDINTYNLISDGDTTPDVCLIKTNKDTTVDIFFGDGISSSIGANTGETINIKYFSVIGEDSNQIGVLNEKIDFSGAITLNGSSISSNTETFFKTNIRNGSNIEDIESIRLNAPAIFQSLDRLVTKVDYSSYLKTLTDPIFVKLSVAWGEADEIAMQRSLGYQVSAIKQLFNIVLCSVLSNVYKLDGYMKPKKLLTGTSEYFEQDDIDTTFVDSNSVDDFAAKTYFDFYIKNDVSSYMNFLYDEDDTNNSQIKSLLKNLTQRSQATVKNIYITPIIQGFELQGDVILKNFADVETEKKKILNAIYKALDNDMNFQTQIYISNITDIINSIPSVKYSSVKFQPVDVDNEHKVENIKSDVISDNSLYNSSTWTNLSNIAADTLFEYLTKNDITSNDIDIRTNNGIVTAEPISDTYLDVNKNDNIKITKLNTIFSDTDKSNNVLVLEDEFRTSKTQNKRITQFTERGFYEEFAKEFYDATAAYTQTDGLTYYRDSEDFRIFINKVKATLQQTLRESMKDEYGNIINYSFPNELPIIYDKLTFKY